MSTEEKKVENEFDDFDTESSGGELFKFETIGDKLAGLIVNKKHGKTKIGDADFYTIQSKDGEDTFVPTKALGEDLAKYIRQYGGIGKVIVSIELTELKQGAFASPFKVFKVRAGAATEARLATMGIQTFDEESQSGDDEAPH